MREVPVLSLAVNPDDLLSECSIGVFAHEDYDNLADHLKKLITTPNLVRKMGERARKVALENYSLSNLDELAEFVTNTVT